MTRSEAIEAAADWWIRAIEGGGWDNGDASTEATHSAFSSLAPRPTKENLAVIRDAIISLHEQGRCGSVTERMTLYSDYGNGLIDRECEDRGVRFSSLLHGPQKAGTMIELKDGEWTVLEKTGYGKGWETLRGATA